MALTTNGYAEDILNPLSLGNLGSSEIFVLSSEQKTLTFVNTSTTETIDILIKGTRPSIYIPSYGNEDISEGLPLTILPFNVAIVIMPKIYKHLGENGDVITISSESPGKENILCWLSE